MFVCIYTSVSWSTCICIYAHLSMIMSTYLFIYLSIYLYIYLPVLFHEYIQVRTYIYIYISYIDVHVYQNIDADAYVRTCLYVDLFTYVCVSTCARFMYTHICLCMDMCICIYI